MTEFDFKRSSRLCRVTGRPIERGSEFYSVLVERDDGSLSREDISASAWPGPPEHCLGWWKGCLPNLDQGRVYWAPPEVLTSVFQHANSTPGQADVAYVMALLLVRKRIWQWKDTSQREGRAWLHLHDPRQNSDFEVAEVSLRPERIAEIQAELTEKLFTSERLSELEQGGSE